MSTIREELLKVTKLRVKRKEDDKVFLARLVRAVLDLDDDDWDKIPVPAQEYANEVSTILLKHADSDGSDLDLPSFPDEEDDKPADEPEEKEKPEEVAEEKDEEDQPPATKRVAKAAKPEKEEPEEKDEKEEPEEKDEEDQPPATKRVAKAAKPEKEEPEEKDEKEEPEEKDEEEQPTAKRVKKKAAANGSDEKPIKKSKPEPEVGEKKVSMCRRLKQIIVKNPDVTVEELTSKLESEGFKSPSKMTVSTIRSDTRDTMKVLTAAGILK